MLTFDSSPTSPSASGLSPACPARLWPLKCSGYDGFVRVPRAASQEAFFVRAHPPDAPTIPGQRSAVSPPVKIRGRRPPQVIDDDATILAISPRQDDRSSLERIFEKSNWKLHTVSGGRE